LLCTEDDNSCYRNVCKMSVVSFALAVVFIISIIGEFMGYQDRLETNFLQVFGHPENS